jgi:ABC transporter substrate binding protein
MPFDQLKRRQFITLLGGAAAMASRSFPAFTQASSKRPLIVASVGGSKAGTERYFGGFSHGMRELGHVEGRDYGFDVRYADGQHDLIPAQMGELLRLNPDVIVAGTMEGMLAAKKLTNTVPIVAEGLVNPIGFSVAASYARPGGNVTGVLLTVEDLPTKVLGVAAYSQFCGQDSQGDQGGRSANRVPHQSGTAHQSDRGKGGGHQRSAYPARPCRRGDRVTWVLLHLLTTGFGTTRPRIDVRDHGESWRVSRPPAATG